MIRLFRAAAGAGVAAALIATGGAAFPGRNGRLVFALERGATVDLYAVPAAGGRLRRLTRSVPRGDDPAVSPDGRLIAFVHTDADIVYVDLWLMRRDGTHARQLTHAGDDEARPSFSPDGRLLAWLTSQGGRIAVVPVAGGKRTILPPRDVQDYTWSPDGRLWVMAGCRMRSVTPRGEVRDGPWLRPCYHRDLVPQPGRWSRDGKRFAWSSGTLRYGGVWVASADGSHARRIFSARRVGTHVAGWLPSGEVVYAVTHDAIREDVPGAQLGIYAARPDGSRRRVVFRGDTFAPELTQGGTTLAWAGAGARIVLAGPAGGAHALGDDRSSWSPAWSPDGRRIVFSSGRDILDGDLYELDARGGRRARLTRGPANDVDAAFSPDGRSLVWRRSQRLVRMRLGSGRVRTLVGGAHPHWSPDGGRIAFAAGLYGERRPSVVDANGANEHLLIPKSTVRPYASGLPAWSPDGKRLAFVIFRRAGPEVDVVDADGTNRRAVAHGSWPVWSPDGREIAYVRGHTLYAAAVASGDERRLGDVHGLFSPPDWQPLRRLTP